MGPGHFLHGKARRCRDTYEGIPWGHALDAGLLAPGDEYFRCDTTPDGKTKFCQLDGWSAVAFWDRSGGDTRPGCNSVFLTNATIGEVELLDLARRQWPEVWGRAGFPLEDR